MKPLVVIVGPTAVGKTDLSINVALNIRGEIISADSMQIYKYMDIGTAKPSFDEMNGIKHYLIDEIEPSEEFSVARYKSLADKYIEKVHSKGNVPILVGGTGLYINSVVDNIKFSESICDWEYRNKLKQIAEIKGNDYLHDMLRKVDPITADKLHVNDVRRIIRGLEVYKFTGVPISVHKQRSRQVPSPYKIVMIGLNMNRQKLYDRINLRVDIMLKQGLVDEVKKLKEMGFTKAMTAMQGLGYKEILNYLDGNISLSEAVEIIKRETRRYAKRQLTWFRRDKRIYWVYLDENIGKKELLKKCLKHIENNGII